MKNNQRNYPKIAIRSKRELAKRLSDKRDSVEDMARLISDVKTNYDNYWTDHPTQSQPEKGKWVRDASRTDLGKLLKLINAKVLAPHDSLIPTFVFGGVSGRNHKVAVTHLLGVKRKRIILKLDISRFFEQIRYERVYNFFLIKSQCGQRGARLLTDLCCVPIGAKDNPGDYKTIGRGFSTSSRLAVWCNLDTFLKLERLVKKELQGKDPRIAIYVDDIAITASGITKEDMMKLYPKIKTILESDKNQKLPLNDAKTKIIYHSGDEYDIDGIYQGKRGFEHLGLQMNRNSLTLGTKTRWKLANLTHRYKESRRKNTTIRKKRKSTLRYKEYVER
jgi:hypothetical protein